MVEEEAQVEGLSIDVRFGGGTGRVVVDLADLTFIGSEGLGVLLEVHHRADMWLRAVSARAMRLFEVAGFVGVSKVEETEGRGHPLG